MKAMKVVLSSGVFLSFVGMFAPRAAAGPSGAVEGPAAVSARAANEDACAGIEDQETCLSSPGCYWDDESQRCAEFYPP